MVWKLDVVGSWVSWGSSLRRLRSLSHASDAACGFAVQISRSVSWRRGKVARIMAVCKRSCGAIARVEDEVTRKNKRRELYNEVGGLTSVEVVVHGEDPDPKPIV